MRLFLKYVIKYYRAWRFIVYYAPKLHTYFQSCSGGVKNVLLQIPFFMRVVTLNYAVI